MNEIGLVVAFIVGGFGFLLYLGMVEENRRTQPARVRQRLKDLGMSDELIDRIEAHRKNHPNHPKEPR